MKHPGQLFLPEFNIGRGTVNGGIGSCAGEEGRYERMHLFTAQ